MPGETIAAALTREHHEIDSGIAEFEASLDTETPRTEALTRATDALRRHIYLEEEYLFPPLRAAGLVPPVMVMLREHGQIWRALDTLDALRADTTPDAAVPTDALRAVLADLTAMLDAHNAKEEPILYPQADAVMDAEAAGELSDLIVDGEMPDGWVCALAGT